ncbi:MAG: patatin-like phospholipase family protein [Azospirillaceae bacterium]
MLVLPLIAGLVGCGGVPDRNAPLDQVMLAPPGDPFISEGGYRTRTFALEHGLGDTFLALAFSGGGKRSASFAYGFLEGLRQIDIGGGRSLLDEVDIIAGVSGGTFPATYYGLHRERIFSDFVDGFLRYDLEADIASLLLVPWNWRWAVDPFYGTNDAMAEIYDDLYLDGATYADLMAAGPPLIMVNATDITNGAVFSFTQDYFDLLCSDLLQEPIARALAASNGFPIVFTPITLNSYAEDCGGRQPALLARYDSLAQTRNFDRLQAIADQFGAYLDPNETQYVHLMDGGIVDNLAMRSMLNAIQTIRLERASDVAAQILAQRPVTFDDIVLISVDGESALDTSWARQPTVSGLAQILSLVTGTQIDAYNVETLALAHAEIAALADLMTEQRCAASTTASPDMDACMPVSGTVLHYSLRQIDDPAIRARLEAIPTGLSIPDEDVDLLVQQGSLRALQSAELLALAERLRGATAVAQQ